MHSVAVILVACAAVAASALHTTMTAWTPEAASVDKISSSPLTAISLDTIQQVALPDGIAWPSQDVLSIDLDLVFNAQSSAAPALGVMAPARASVVLSSTDWAAPQQVAPPAQTTDRSMLKSAAALLQHLVPSLGSDGGPYFATESLLRELLTPAVLHSSSQLRGGRVALHPPQAVAVHGPKLLHNATVLEVDSSEAWRVLPHRGSSAPDIGALVWGGGMVPVPANAAVLTATLDHTVDVPLSGIVGSTPQWGQLFSAPAADSAALSPLSLHISAVKGSNNTIIVRVTHMYEPIVQPKDATEPASVFLGNRGAVPQAVAAAVSQAAGTAGGATLAAPVATFGTARAQAAAVHSGAFVVLCSSAPLPSSGCVGTGFTPAGSAAAPLPAPVSAHAGQVAGAAKLKRAVTGPGLHREALYTVDAEISAASVMKGGGGGGGGSHCLLAMHQRLERTTYVDLDELREISRVGGPNFVSYTHYIDVERPTSASWQHEVVMTHPLPVLSSGNPGGEAQHWTAPSAGALAAAWLGSAAPQGSVDAFTPIGASPWASASARSMMRSSISKAARENTWRLQAEIRMPFHVRYQSVGCAESAEVAQQGAELFVTPSPRNESTVLPLVQGCYGGVHLPLPTLHISCDGGKQWNPLRTQNTAWPAPGWCPGGGGEFEPFEGQLPGAAVTDASCELTPPLRPVPVGVTSHFSVVSSVTALCTLGVSLVLILTGLRQSHPLRSTGKEEAAADAAHGDSPKAAVATTAASDVSSPPAKQKPVRARSSGRRRKA